MPIAGKVNMMPNAEAQLPPEQPQAVEGTHAAPAGWAVNCSASLCAIGRMSNYLFAEFEQFSVAEIVFTVVRSPRTNFKVGRPKPVPNMVNRRQ